MDDKVRTIQTIRQRALNFLGGLKSLGSVVIVYDADCDGVCSAALMGRGILSMTGVTPETIPAQWGRSLELQLSSLNAEFTVFLDTPAIPARILDHIVETNKTIIIDHHTPEPYPNVEYLNPRMTMPQVYLPTSYLVYNVWNDILDETVSTWIAATGVLADHGVLHCTDLFNKVANIHPNLVGGVEMDNEPLLDSSTLGRLVSLTNAAIAIRGGEGAQFVCRVLLTSDHYAKLLQTDNLEGQMLNGWYKAYQEEFRRVLQTLDAGKLEISENILVFNVESSLRLKSALADYLPRRFPDHIVTVVQRKGQSLYVSFRRGNRVRVDLAKFAKQVASMIPDASGGGHPEAAAAKLSSKYYSMLLETLKKVAQSGAF